MISKIIAGCLAIFIAVLTPVKVTAQSNTVANAQPSESIQKFESYIILTNNGSLEVTETITYQTQVAKHGIYRYIPSVLDQAWWSVWRTPISQVIIKDESGQDYQFEQSTDDGTIFLKIGDPDTTFTGQKKYLISYKVDRAAREFTDSQQLFWDITGEGWQLPIMKTEIVIDLPASPSQVLCFIGELGSTQPCSYTLQQNQVVVQLDETISYGQNVSIGVKFEPGTLHLLPEWQRLLRDNWVWILTPLPLVLSLWGWWIFGRDEVFISADIFNFDSAQDSRTIGLFSPRPIRMSYTPLQISPGLAQAIYSLSVKPSAVVAEILELARKKVLKIERLSTKKMFGTKNEYQFIQLRDKIDGLSRVQKMLFKGIFSSGKQQIKLSDLKGKFHTTFSKVQTELSKEMEDQRWVQLGVNKARVWGYVLLGIGVTTLFGWLVAWQGLLAQYLVLVLSSIVSMIIVWFLPSRTAIGSNWYEQARGLRETVKRGAWRQKIQEQQLFVDQVLPFAVALGVVDRLSKDLDDVGLQPSYLASDALGGLAASSFVSDFTSQASSSLAYNPSSSSASSGGFSGGSGGGGGGGGGGSW